MNKIIKLSTLIVHKLFFLFPRNKKTFVFIGWHKKKDGEVFADNAKYFFLYMSQHHREVKSIWIAKSEALAQKLREHGYCSYYEKSLRGIWSQLRADFFVIDAFLQPLPYMLSGNSKIVQLLHGKGMKKKGYAEKQDKTQDFIFNTSPFSESILPEVFKTGSKTFITGYSRNDVFYKNIKDSNLDTDQKMIEHVQSIKTTKQVIMYAPTFRRGQKEFNFEKVLPLDDLRSFAEKNNLFFILSLHNKYRAQQGEGHIEEHIGFLEESDIYPLLPHIDIFITDYSSSFADYLLLDRPLIFYPYDFAEYDENEGLAADYNDITPGPKVFEYQKLKEEILKVTTNDEYTKDRGRIRNLYHAFQDGNSSERIWKEIKSEI